MAYGKIIHEEAKNRWIRGEPITSIIKDPHMPNTAHIIIIWKEKENWQADLEEIYKKAIEANKDSLQKEVAQMNKNHLAQLKAVQSLVAGLLTEVVGVRVFEDKRINTDELQKIMNTIDKAINKERVIRDQITDKQQIDQEGKIKHEHEHSGTLNLSQLSDTELDRVVQNLQTKGD